MKHYICRTVTETPAYMQAQINISGDDKIGAGYVFNANKLEDKEGNLAVYELEKISNSEKQIPAILLNNDFETLTDGRRPKGNKDWTTYTFNKGSVVTAIRLLPEIKLEISLDSVILEDTVDEVGGYLIPKDNDMQLHYYKNINESELPRVYLVVEALKDFRLGGNFGGQFAKTFVARVQEKCTSSGIDITDATATASDIMEGKVAYTNSGRTIGTLKKGTDCSFLFFNGTKLDTLDETLALYNNIVNTSCMFAGDASYPMPILSDTTDLNLTGKLDTSHVTDMSYMFSSMYDRNGNGLKFNSINLGDKFDTKNVINMKGMFSGARDLTTLNLGDKFDTSNVINMNSMFYRTVSLTTLNLGDKFDTSNVTDMSDMFNSAGTLETLDLGDKFDTSNVTDMGGMFAYAGWEALKTLNLGDKFDTSNVTNMGGMFLGIELENLDLVDLVSKFDTGKVEIMRYMFSSTHLTDFTFGEKFTAENCLELDNMFEDCTSLKEINFRNFRLREDASIYNMFGGCENLSNNSLNNILEIITTVSTHKRLDYIGLTREQAEICTTLSNWSAAQEAGWTTGY
ncbi:MAG: BspA family leucine-rich repeat surface protein [Mollicutes bacterium]|nr:BspA family leucine-rich repeat surface protein [Mollicutes bacterium]